jgi:hypothetical protein
MEAVTVEAETAGAAWQGMLVAAAREVAAREVVTAAAATVAAAREVAAREVVPAAAATVAAAREVAMGEAATVVAAREVEMVAVAKAVAAKAVVMAAVAMVEAAREAGAEREVGHGRGSLGRAHVWRQEGKRTRQRVHGGPSRLARGPLSRAG